MNATQLDAFTLAYIECAFWSSTDDSDEPMDANYGIDDLAPEALAVMLTDCGLFQALNSADIPETETDRAGHDFWLTRNGHGAGFWDGDWPDEEGERLTAASKRFGKCDLYIGDDGLVYTA